MKPRKGNPLVDLWDREIRAHELDRLRRMRMQLYGDKHTAEFTALCLAHGYDLDANP